jgi:hypothetical protein
VRTFLGRSNLSGHFAQCRSWRNSVAHLHLNPDDIIADFNIALPLELFAELERDGEIGSLAENNYSFMGVPRTFIQWLTRYLWTGPRATFAGGRRQSSDPGADPTAAETSVAPRPPAYPTPPVVTLSVRPASPHISKMGHARARPDHRQP